MALTSAHASRNGVPRYDGATMGERVAERLDSLMGTLEYVQDCIDSYGDAGRIVPDYLYEQYQSALDSLECFASYWGFDY